MVERSAHNGDGKIVLRQAATRTPATTYPPISMRNRVVAGSSPVWPTQHLPLGAIQIQRWDMTEWYSGQPTEDSSVKRLALALFSDRETCVGEAARFNSALSTQQVPVERLGGVSKPGKSEQDDDDHQNFEPAAQGTALYKSIRERGSVWPTIPALGAGDPGSNPGAPTCPPCGASQYAGGPCSLPWGCSARSVHVRVESANSTVMRLTHGASPKGPPPLSLRKGGHIAQLGQSVRLLT